MSLVCVDASLVLLILLPQERSERAEGLWATWQNEGNQVIAPPLLYAEVPSVLREAVFHHRLTEEEGEEAFEVFCQLGVRAVSPPDLHIRAWRLAKVCGLPRVYDMHYAALAESQRCPLYTADRRLVNALGARLPRVHWVGEEGRKEGA